MAVPGDSTVRWFHSGMPNAPALTATPGHLIDLIDACLIDGFDVRTINNLAVEDEVAVAEISSGHSYEKHAVIRISGASPEALNGDWRIIAATGSTLTFNAPGVSDATATGEMTARFAPPGYWEKAFSAGNRAAYRSTHPDATGYYLHVNNEHDGNNDHTLLRGYRSMSDIDEGSDPFPTFDQESEEGYRIRPNSTASSDGRPWAIVCDGMLVYLIFSSFNDDFSRAGFYYFGDVRSYSDTDDTACVIAAHAWTLDVSQPTTNISTYNFSGSADGQYFARAALGGITPVSVRQYGSPATQYSSRDANDISEHFGQLVFHHPVLSTEPGGFVRGYFPGLYQGLQPAELLIPGGGIEVVEPSPTLSKALLLTVGWSSNYYYTFDIWGPWR